MRNLKSLASFPKLSIVCSTRTASDGKLDRSLLAYDYDHSYEAISEHIFWLWGHAFCM